MKGWRDAACGQSKVSSCFWGCPGCLQEQSRLMGDIGGKGRSDFSHSTSSSHPPLPVFFPKFPSEAEQVSIGMGGAGAAAWSLGAVHDKVQVWGRSEQISALTEPLNLFLWDGDLHAKPRESAVAKYAKSCGEAVSEAGPA